MEPEVLYNIVDHDAEVEDLKPKTSITKKVEFSEKKAKKDIIKLLKKPKTLYIYDLVKVRVTLDDHFYILSRFMISRMLCLIKV